MTTQAELRRAREEAEAEAAMEAAEQQHDDEDMWEAGEGGEGPGGGEREAGGGGSGSGRKRRLPQRMGDYRMARVYHRAVRPQLSSPVRCCGLILAEDGRLVLFICTQKDKILGLYSRVLPVFGLAGNRRASPSHALRSTQKWSVNKQRLLSNASTKLISHRSGF